MPAAILVIITGYLRGYAGEGNREFARWIEFTGNHFRRAKTTEITAVEHFNDGVAVLHSLTDAKRLTVDENGNDGFSRRFQAAHQLFLSAR